MIKNRNIANYLYQNIGLFNTIVVILSILCTFLNETKGNCVIVNNRYIFLTKQYFNND